LRNGEKFLNFRLFYQCEKTLSCRGRGHPKKLKIKIQSVDALFRKPKDRNERDTTDLSPCEEAASEYFRHNQKKKLKEYPRSCQRRGFLLNSFFSQHHHAYNEQKKIVLFG